MLQIISSLVRHILTIAAGYIGGDAVTSVDDKTIELVAAGVMAAVAFIWSIIEKKLFSGNK